MYIQIHWYKDEMYNATKMKLEVYMPHNSTYNMWCVIDTTYYAGRQSIREREKKCFTDKG